MVVVIDSSVPRRVARLQPVWRKCMTTTRRPVSTMVLIGLSETNTIGHYSRHPETAWPQGPPSLQLRRAPATPLPGWRWSGPRLAARMRRGRIWQPALCSSYLPPSSTLRLWFTPQRSALRSLGGGAMPDGDHVLIGLHHPRGAAMTRFKREANLQGWHGCSTCHDGLLAAVTSASQEATPSGGGPPETRHHSQVVGVSVEYSSRTLPGCWQHCRKCTFPGPGQHDTGWVRKTSQGEVPAGR